MYVDSNIFIFAAIDKGDLGQHCRTIISMIADRKITCASSYLVIDEVIWVLKKRIGKESAIRITKAMLSLPIKWVDVDGSVILMMMDAYENTKLDPRDAIHLSSMKKNGLSVIISEDNDFDGVETIERIDAVSCVERDVRKR